MNVEKDKTQARIAGLIYAGGRGLRMGGRDKALIEKTGEALIAHMSRALGQYASEILISRQADQADLSQYGKVLIDEDKDQGPLAGLVHALKTASEFDYLLTAPVDAQRLPPDYFAALLSVAHPHAMAKTGDQLHPTFSLIAINDAQNIIAGYQNGARALRFWADDANCGYANFATDAFENINQF